MAAAALGNRQPSYCGTNGGYWQSEDTRLLAVPLHTSDKQKQYAFLGSSKIHKFHTSCRLKPCSFHMTPDSPVLTNALDDLAAPVRREDNWLEFSP